MPFRVRGTICEHCEKAVVEMRGGEAVQGLRHLRQETADFKNRGVSHLAMKIAFVSQPVPGHLNPMTTLARALQSRNHDVVFISLPDRERSVRAAGLPFLPCAVKEFPAGSLTERLRWLSKLQREDALPAALH